MLFAFYHREKVAPQGRMRGRYTTAARKMGSVGKAAPHPPSVGASGTFPQKGKAFYYFSVSGISSVQTFPFVSVTRTTYFGSVSPSYSQPFSTSSL